MTPRFPDVVVDVGLQKGRPVAAIALVRRALQKAGYGSEALEFTQEAMACDEDGVIATAHRWVTVREAE